MSKFNSLNKRHFWKFLIVIFLLTFIGFFSFLKINIDVFGYGSGGGGASGVWGGSTPTPTPTKKPTPTPACSDTRSCGAKCAASGCDACACDGDSRSSSYNWSSLGCSRDCKTCYCGRRISGPTSTPGGATHKVCSGTSCVTVSGAGSNQCSSNSDCGGGGGGGGNASCNPVGQRCSPAGQWIDSCCRCGPDGRTGLDYSPAGAQGSSGWCACASQYNFPAGWEASCGSAPPPPPPPQPGDCPAGYNWCAWENSTCSFSGTRSVAYGASGQFVYQTHTNTVACNNSVFGDPIRGTVKSCCTIPPTPSCTMSLSPSSMTLKTGGSGILTANVNLVNATVKQVDFTSADSNIAKVNPSSAFPPAPYHTNVYGLKAGSTTISATTLLNPSGSCAAPSSTSVSVEASGWFQTQGGDIYSGANLSNDIPETADDRNLSLKLDNWPGIISHQDPDGVNLGSGFPSNDTANHWLAESKYEGKPYGSFQFFKKKFAMEMQTVDYPESINTITDVPAENRVYYAQGNKTLNGNWVLDVNRWIVLLVEGNVNIQRNIRIPVGSFLAIAATGNIILSDEVGQVHGMFVADGTIDTGSGMEEFKGEGVFAASSFDLGRDFGDATNETTPIEFFKARPDFIMSSYKDADNNLWWFFQKWQEVAP